jgi:uncharacterized protein (TIGR00297 family)
LRDLLLGAIVAGAIAFAAWKAHALTRDGALAATAVGAFTYASGTFGFTLLLLAFFIPSVALSRLGKARKRTLVDIGKAGPRDAAQVLANGGVATLCAIAFALTHDPRWAWAFAGSYAAATADTWATEIGTLARQRPRSIFTLRPIATGLSGGITLPGTLAEVAGAAWIAIAAVPCLALSARSVTFGGVFATLLAGVLGSTLDSVLGASAQELRRCEKCDRTCETDPHVCGAPTRLVRGIAGVSNDLVNFVATAAGAAVAFALST